MVSQKKANQFFGGLQIFSEVVHIDILLEYEETLLILEDCEIIMYIEDKLAEFGIGTCKYVVDDKFKLVNRRKMTYRDLVNEGKLSIVGENFMLKELFSGELTQEYISSISLNPGQVFHLSLIHI